MTFADRVRDGPGGWGPSETGERVGSSVTEWTFPASNQNRELRRAGETMRMLFFPDEHLMGDVFEGERRGVQCCGRFASAAALHTPSIRQNRVGRG